MKTVEALGYTIFADHPENIPFDSKTIIHTINQYSYCLSFNNKKFGEALHQANILLPDGIGITLSINLLYGKRIKKIAGADIYEFLLNKADREKLRCFYLGSSNMTLKKIEKRILFEHPDVKAGSYSPPFKDEFSEEDNSIIIEKINTFSPDILFVGLSAPKQEKWVEENRHFIQAKIICTVGAVFDFYAGNIQRAHPFCIKLGLEWLVRFIKEPNRMWKRYLLYGPIFICRIALLKLRQRSTHVLQEFNNT